MMRCRMTYAVELRDGHWTIAFCGIPAGSYPTRREAIHAAAYDAKRVSKMAHNAKVEVTYMAGASMPS